MPNIVQIKRKSGSNPSSLASGELALRLDTGELFTYDGTSIIKIGSKNLLTKAGGTLTGYLILHANPTDDMHPATKAYVDAMGGIGLDIKPSCIAATTSNISLYGLLEIDGVQLVAGNRVLVKNQENETQNGIYVAASESWSRAADFTQGTASWGAFTFIEKGTTNKGKGFVAISNAGLTGDIEIGTDAIPFTQFSGGLSYTAGNGIDITGNVISAKSGNATITIDSAGIKVGTIAEGNIGSGAVTEGKLGSQCVSPAKLGAIAGTGLSGGSGSALAVVYGSTAGTACQGNDSRLHTQNTDTGTSNSTFQIGASGLKIKTSSSVLQVRTSADDLFAPIQPLSVKIANNSNSYTLTLSGTATGSDKILTIPDETGTILTSVSTIDGGTW